MYVIIIHLRAGQIYGHPLMYIIIEQALQTWHPLMYIIIIHVRAGITNMAPPDVIVWEWILGIIILTSGAGCKSDLESHTSAFGPN